MKNKKTLIAMIVAVVIVVLEVVAIAYIYSNKDTETSYDKIIDKYLSAYSEFDTDSLVEIIDFKAYDWDLDVSTFEDTYNSVSDEDAESYKEEFEESLASYQSYYDYYGYSDMLELVSVDETEETEVSGLVKVKASIKETVTYDGEDTVYDSQVYFYIYNNKIVAMDSIDEDEDTEEDTDDEIDEDSDTETDETTDEDGKEDSDSEDEEDY